MIRCLLTGNREMKDEIMTGEGGVIHLALTDYKRREDLQ